eukprot:3362406-Pyramimonas_sp.AAC.1
MPLGISAEARGSDANGKDAYGAWGGPLRRPCRASGQARGIDEMALLLQQVDPLLEQGREFGEVALLPGLHPRLVARRAQLGRALGDVF